MRITRFIKPSETTAMTIWLESLPLLDDGEEPYNFTGPSWGDKIIFYRPEDELMFRLKFGV